MGKQYVVTVFEVDTESDSETTLVELRAPVEMLAQFAPQAVAAALGASAAAVEAPEQPRMAMTGPTLADVSYGPDTAARVRKRRTKAEMEAARRAEMLAASVVEPHNAMISELDNDGEPKAPTVTTTFESAKPIPVETPTSGSGYRPFG